MGSFILRMLIKALIGRILTTLDTDDLLFFVSEAEAEYDNPFAKRGHVHRAVKAAEPEGVSGTVVNLAIELGVYFYKKLQ